MSAPGRDTIPFGDMLRFCRRNYCKEASTWSYGGIQPILDKAKSGNWDNLFKSSVHATTFLSREVELAMDRDSSPDPPPKESQCRKKNYKKSPTILHLSNRTIVRLTETLDRSSREDFIDILSHFVALQVVGCWWVLWLSSMGNVVVTVKRCYFAQSQNQNDSSQDA